MSIKTILVRLKKPSKKKQHEWITQQNEFINCANHCVTRIHKGEKLTSKNVDFPLKSIFKNEAILCAKKAVSDYENGRAKKLPTFKKTLNLRINNQNWYTACKKGRWYILFTTNTGRKAMPVFESKNVLDFFPYLTKNTNAYRNRIELVRKKKKWFVAIPIEISCELNLENKTRNYTHIGVDLGLRNIISVAEPKSNKRIIVSGRQVGYKRRHYQALRRKLGKKKAQRAIKRIGNKERRWIKDYNRKLAKVIVTFCLQFDNPMLKVEDLKGIRNRLKRKSRFIHQWSFFQLLTFIKELALKHNIPVILVKPCYTSQTCSNCGFREKKNRNKQKFFCLKCGYRSHSDLNAAKNIAGSTNLAA